MVWRPVITAEVGWSHRVFSNFQHINMSDPAYPTDYRLTLSAVHQDLFTATGGVGLEWSTTNHLSFSFVPRFQVVLGSGGGWTVLAPGTVAWSWYL